jgi:hypothetical protein
VRFEVLAVESRLEWPEWDAMQLWTGFKVLEKPTAPSSVIRL